MCVILVSESRPLMAKLVDQAMAENPHGNGFAWIEGQGKKKTVHYEKGLTRSDVFQLLKTNLPLPYVFHARIASIGGIHPNLTHPFPVSERKKQMRMSGSNKKGVVFHNGTWREWQDYYEETPNGLWSDSRAMADLIHQYGEGAIDIIPETQRVARMTTEGVTLHGMGWSEVSKGIMASNRYFLRGPVPIGGMLAGTGFPGRMAGLDECRFVPRLTGPVREPVASQKAVRARLTEANGKPLVSAPKQLAAPRLVKK